MYQYSLLILCILSIASVNVSASSDKPEDITPPQLLEAKIVGTLAPGAEAQLWLRATDELSGIKNFSAYYIRRSIAGSDTKSTNQIEVNGDQVTAQDGDWYSIPIKLNEYIGNGTYTIGTITVTDNALNTNGYWASPSEDGSLIYNSNEGIGPNVPVVTFEIKR